MTDKKRYGSAKGEKTQAENGALGPFVESGKEKEGEMLNT